MKKRNVLTEWYDDNILKSPQDDIKGDLPNEAPEPPVVIKTIRPEEESKSPRDSKFNFLTCNLFDSVNKLKTLDDPFGENEEMRIFLLDQAIDFIKKIQEV